MWMSKFGLVILLATYACGHPVNSEDDSKVEATTVSELTRIEELPHIETITADSIEDTATEIPTPSPDIKDQVHKDRDGRAQNDIEQQEGVTETTTATNLDSRKDTDSEDEVTTQSAGEIQRQGRTESSHNLVELPHEQDETTLNPVESLLRQADNSKDLEANSIHHGDEADNEIFSKSEDSQLSIAAPVEEVTEEVAPSTESIKAKEAEVETATEAIVEETTVEAELPENRIASTDPSEPQEARTENVEESERTTESIESRRSSETTTDGLEAREEVTETEAPVVQRLLESETSSPVEITTFIPESRAEQKVTTVEPEKTSTTTTITTTTTATTTTSSARRGRAGANGESVEETTDEEAQSTATESEGSVIDNVADPEEVPVEVNQNELNLNENHDVTESSPPSGGSPVIEIAPSMLHFFRVKEAFVLVCLARSESGPVKYSWLKNGRPFHLDGNNGQQVFRESPFDGNIIFVVPVAQDVGTYQCIAENKSGKTFSHPSLVMLQKPQHEPRNLNIFAKARSDEDVAVVGAQPLPEFKENPFIVLPKSDGAQVLDMEIMTEEPESLADTSS